MSAIAERVSVWAYVPPCHTHDCGGDPWELTYYQPVLTCDAPESSQGLPVIIMGKGKMRRAYGPADLGAGHEVHIPDLAIDEGPEWDAYRSRPFDPINPPPAKVRVDRSAARAAARNAGYRVCGCGAWGDDPECMLERHQHQQAAARTSEAQS